MHLWQIDDVDSVVGTLLHANTTTNTEFLGNEANLGVALDFHAELADFHLGTVSSAFQVASGGFALHLTPLALFVPSRHQQ